MIFFKSKKHKPHKKAKIIAFYSLLFCVKKNIVYFRFTKIFHKIMNKKLIAVRKARKITQADIATYLKISQTQYQKRENGKIKISDLEWKKISKLLDIEVDEIYEEHIESNTIDLKEELQILKEKIKILEQKLA